LNVQTSVVSTTSNVVVSEQLHDSNSVDNNPILRIVFFILVSLISW